MAPATSVIAITLNWNGAADTIGCVQALLRSRQPLHQIVVCDNASRADSWQALLGLAALVGEDRFASYTSLAQALAAPVRPPVVLIQTGANLGYAGGMNVGMRYALADAGMSHCWVLNNDTEADPDALGFLLARSAAEPRPGICGATLLLHHDRQRVQALGGASYQPWRARSAALGIGLQASQIPSDATDVEARMAYVNGAAMLVRREFLARVGLMDASYFLYSEEHDWAYRGQQAGFALAWAPEARVFHKHGATIGTASSGGSTLSLFYLFRSKLMFTARHQWWCAPTALLSLAWDATKFALKGQGQKAHAAFKGLAAAGFRQLQPPVKR
jgi:GT2 family glycosyltransferase